MDTKSGSSSSIKANPKKKIKPTIEPMTTARYDALRSLPEDSVLFTSESVTEGHPDKLCDQVSDAILDACLAQDPNSRVACEAGTKTGIMMIFGEITTSAKINHDAVVREAIKAVGYDDGDKGFDYKSCCVSVMIAQQSTDIAQGIRADRMDDDNLGAGDQGHMFGYATDETEEMMPMSHSLATKLVLRLMECRKKNILPWLRPDGKTQVTVEYKKDPSNPYLLHPFRVHTIVVSAQHSPDIDNDSLRKGILEEVVKKVIPPQMLDSNTVYHINPSGRFVIGGPTGDAGVTGRKIIVDSYGGWGAHGGGAFSGKDPSKVDRSGAYAARWIAKSLVAAKLCKRVLVQISYGIGIAEPLSINVNTYGTGVAPDAKIIEIILNNFDLRPAIICRQLNLRRPIYRKTAAGGHFGRIDDPDFTWEIPKHLMF